MKKGVESSIIILSSILILTLLAFTQTPSQGNIITQGLSISGNLVSIEDLDELQYYKNLRFKNTTISYEINETCSQTNKQNTLRAFAILQNQTSLIFQETKDAQINIQCDTRIINIYQKRIKGEGGPEQIFSTLNYNIITNSKVTLFQEESCESPNLALHETLHALGFTHTEDESSILFPESNCEQTLKQETINKINELYKAPPFADLQFQDISIKSSGSRYTLTAEVINLGLENSQHAVLTLSSNNKQFAEYPLGDFPTGAGKSITIKKLNIPNKPLSLTINTESQEINKENNQGTLELK